MDETNKLKTIDEFFVAAFEHSNIAKSSRGYLQAKEAFFIGFSAGLMASIDASEQLKRIDHHAYIEARCDEGLMALEEVRAALNLIEQ